MKLHLKPVWVCLILIVALVSCPSERVEFSGVTHPDPKAALDVEWYQQTLITTVDLWNGGLEGGTGMGAYKPGFTGYFNVTLNRKWEPGPLAATTSVAQSRAIYINAEAYRSAGPEQGKRFLNALLKGTQFLLDHFRDKKNGGFFWQADGSGAVRSTVKQAYGNVHPLFALAQVFAVTHETRFLDAAREQLDVIEKHFLDPALPGSFKPDMAADFSRVIGHNGIDPFTHYFEALLALYDVTDGADKERVTRLINEAGNFIVTRLYQDQKGFSGRGYVAYNYDQAWRPEQAPYTRQTQWTVARHASTGHGIELAYLLSRAVERGFNPGWMTVAYKMLKFVEKYALNDVTGGMRYELMDYDGTPIVENPDNPYYLWWPNAETARAMLHFTVLRDAASLSSFKKVEYLIHNYLTDQEYGGWYNRISATNLMPDLFEKGNVWKVNYHYSLFFAEAIRLGRRYPDIVGRLNKTYMSDEITFAAIDELAKENSKSD